MTAVLVISIVTCILMMLSVLVKPSFTVKGVSVGLYWIVAVLGAVALLVGGLVSPIEVWQGLTADTAINPLKILALFLSMAVLSVFLDELGFFSYVANAVLKRAKSNTACLFVYLYITVSVLTVVTSNDIIILTFTPFICYFCKHANISPIPFLVSEFVAANTWSMLFVIGNPTNIYLATSAGITFAEYFAVMALPTLFGGLTSFCVLYLIFKKQLSVPIEPQIEDIKITDAPLLIIGAGHLAACIIMLVISSYIGLEMWLITVCFAASLFICVLIDKAVKRKPPVELWHCIKRAPWELVPFVISMSVLVLALDKYGVTSSIGVFFGEKLAALKYGTASFLFANIINNIPMSVLFSAISSGLTGEALREAVYASVIGSNIGAYLTPVGALAGIMWLGIMKKQGVKFGFLDFVKYGAVVSVPVLFAAIGGLYLALTFA